MEKIFKDILKTDHEIDKEIRFKYPKPSVAQLFDVSIFNEISEKYIQDINFIKDYADYVMDRVNDLNQQILSMRDETMTELRKLQSLIGVYQLYNDSPTGDIVYYSDNFHNIDLVDKNTTCAVNTDEYAVTLPVISSTTISMDKAIVSIGHNSKGSLVGTSKEQFAIDGDPATYLDFSYNASQIDNRDYALLELNISLQEPQIINYITIMGVNTGAKDNIRIKSIEVSADGKEFIHLIDDINDNKYFTIRESPSDLGYELSPNFNFSFIPQYVKEIKITFLQSSPIYDTDSGIYSYKIGIYDVILKLNEYANNGILTSKSFTLKNIPAEIALVAHTNLAESKHDAVQYAINIAGKHIPISPISSKNKNEILFFNQPWIDSSHQIPNDTRKFSFIVKMDKNNKNLPSTVINKNISITTSEYIEIPSNKPYSIELEQTPAKDSLHIIMYPFTSVGKNDKIKIGNYKENQDTYSIKLPFDVKNNVVVKVGSHTLRRYDNLADLTNYGAFGYYITDDMKLKVVIRPQILDRVHDPNHIDHIGGPVNKYTAQAIFEENHTAYKTIKDGDEITMHLDADILSADKNRQLHLSYVSDEIPENFQITQYTYTQDGEPLYEEIIEYMPKGTKELQLSRIPYNDPSYSIVVPDSYEVKYIDGITEFMKNNLYAFSIDYETGRLYRRYPAPVDMTITYRADYRQPVQQGAFSVVDEHTLLLSPSVFTGDSEKIVKYAVSYNVAAEFPSSNYELDGNKVTLTDKTILDLFLNQIDIDHKIIKAVYSYEHKLTIDKETYKKYFTPILRSYKLKVLYHG